MLSGRKSNRDQLWCRDDEERRTNDFFLTTTRGEKVDCAAKLLLKRAPPSGADYFQDARGVFIFHGTDGDRRSEWVFAYQLEW